MPQTLHIKNMVCHRCIRAVNDGLVALGLHPVKVELGEVVLQEDSLSPEEQAKLEGMLNDLGFERIDDKRSRLIEKIKKFVINTVHDKEGMDRKLNWSSVLSDEMHYEYNYLSNLFSSVEGITLEQYIIRQKIERVKELLSYDQLTLSEIAHLLDYSSVQHLSNQFKKVTGFTPSEFKKLRDSEHQRKPLDAVH
jgi:AraC family transcriptional regulator